MITRVFQSLTKSLSHALLVVAALGGALAVSVPAQAQELKIGYVNSERVLRDATPAKAALARMEADFVKRDKDLNDQAAKLKGAADKLEKDAPTLSEGEKNRRQRELVENDRDLQRKRREFQEDLNQRRNEETAAIVERANKVIKQIFETEKYDLILQDVVFAGPRVDITDKVIKALNAAAGSK
ncbi:OmpH family outer membrane protein [Aquabacterium sp. OR-4]|uniref:OmpH family outer membrane protein n=1 Tax=Aquabacterium sp. OR-4 TaxID=2978127 RepID=UPI0028C64818|nr:OmpH family outer membrane protein [Aquabacterium sp. OR-4]MDT7835453.1 OmpH family outer membrane protein [Aquabacterium sp. OR-4]